jgi:hypothetical protein
MNTGLIRGESIVQYHATDAIGHSKLEVFRDSDRGPARFHGQFIAKTIPPRESSEAMDIGNAVDSLVLEKRLSFIVQPETYKGLESQKKDAPLIDKPWNWNANACKEWGQANRGSLILSKKDADLVSAMRDAVFANQTADTLLSRGEAQTTWRHKFGAFVAQIRPDWWNHDGVRLPEQEIGHYMCDLKSAEDFAQFLSNRRAFGYDRQAALYREVSRLVLSRITGTPIDEVSAPEFFFIVVFKTPPVQCVVYRPSAEDMAAATEEITDDLIRLKRCYETNTWPGVPAGINELPKIWRKAA